MQAGFPVAFLQMQVDTHLPNSSEGAADDAGHSESQKEQLARQRQGDPTEDVIRQLEAGLRK